MMAARFYRCEGVTLKGRTCKRAADVHYYKGDSCIKHFCTQHREGAGAMRLMLPHPWEYDHIERGRQ
jgi:hypothetical protein